MPFLEDFFSTLTRVPPRGGIEAKVEAELLRVAFRAATFGLYINIFIPIILFVVLSKHLEPWQIGCWTLGLVTISVVRLWSQRVYFQRERALDEFPAWTQYFRLGVFATAAMWGIASWLFLEIEHPVVRSLIIFLITGLNAGAARSLSPIHFCFTPYSVLILGPIVYRYASHPHDGGWAFALLTVVYIVFLAATARSQRQELSRMFRSLIENEALLADLREAKQRAEVASKAKSEFLSTISHEIHTPMHGVLGMLQLVEQSPLDAEQRVHVDVAMGSAKALHALLRDVLDFSQIESGRLEIARTPFNPTLLLNEACAYLNAASEAKESVRLELRTTVPADLPAYVVGDPERLRQVLHNLLGNAVKFTDKGRVEFVVSTVVSKPEFVVLRFVVEDTGIGMTDEVQSRLFERFTQGNASASRRHGGIGLGLAIAQQLVWRMGGEIKVKSAVGHGSQFSFDLPLPRATAAAGAEAESAGAARFDPLEGRVLVVDDDRASRQVVELMLSRWSVEVASVASAAEAIESIQNWKPSLVLMDVGLPVVDGLAATRQVRQLALSVPIVALTANTTPQIRSDCLEAGMDGFLAKPVQAAELQRCLKRWLRSPVN